jgi:protein-S-isoprenylcysteine O-methyltransferase Ste14
MSDSKKTTSKEIDMKALKKIVLTRSLMMFVILGMVFVLTAWTLKYWEGWAYIITLALPVSIFGIYLFKNDPKLLERRMRTNEKRKEQKMVLKFSFLCFPFIYILPGLDKRFNWSQMPILLEMISLFLVLIGYVMIMSVLKSNSYASRIIEVDENQKVISTGPYAIVRHPMYSSVIIFYFFTPIALGSYFAVIPALLFSLVLIPRIIGEENELLESLDGYREYTQKVKYRLIPGIW